MKWKKHKKIQKKIKVGNYNGYNNKRNVFRSIWNIKSMSIPLKEQDINRKSLAMIALFHYNYWCETEEERKKFKNMLETNEEKYQKEMQEKYSNDKIFNKATTKIEEETISEKVDRFVEVSNQSTANIVEYKQSFFNKIIDKIKQWFNIFK